MITLPWQIMPILILRLSRGLALMTQWVKMAGRFRCSEQRKARRVGELV